jgi:alkylated DNA repair dioxygenase AlkB
MTGRARVPLLLAAAVVTAALAVPSAAAADSGSGAPGVVALDARRIGTPERAPATMRVAAAQRKKSPTRRVQHVTVRWKGDSKRKRTYARTAVVPGIGQLTLMCRPDATYIRLRAEDRSAETQLWTAKYEPKDDHDVVAVKTARIYRYAHANDDGTGGTGPTATEGLNQHGNIENVGQGYLDGVISQRPGRHQPVAGSAPTPVTSLKLNWWWTGFRNPPSWRSCKIDAVLTTTYQPRMGLSWHGTDDSVGRTTADYRLAGLGTLQLQCEPGVGGDEGRQTVSLIPLARNTGSTVWAETITGEGLVEDHVDTTSLSYDSETGRIGSIDLPRNGIVKLYFTVGGKRRAFILSSYVVANDESSPRLNLCETAVASMPWS